MTNHTPAPWRVSNAGGSVKSETLHICTLETIPLRITPEVKANAYLISASPELLKACEMAEYCLSNEEIVTEEDKRRTLEAISAALRKAKP